MKRSFDTYSERHQRRLRKIYQGTEENDCKLIENSKEKHPSSNLCDQSSSDDEVILKKSSDEVWLEIIKFWKQSNTPPKIFARLILDGIPSAYRADIWILQCAGKNFDEMIKKYRDFCSEISNYDFVRMKEINNSISHFKKSDTLDGNSLYRICTAYSKFDSQVCYSQDLSLLAGCILSIIPEEQAFCVLFFMMKIGMRDLFLSKKSPKWFEFNKLVENMLPELFQHFHKIGMEPVMFIKKWYLSIFTADFSQEMSLRVIDIFLVQGLFALNKVACAILMMVQQQILHLNFDSSFTYLTKEIPKIFYKKENYQEVLELANKIIVKDDRYAFEDDDFGKESDDEIEEDECPFYECYKNLENTEDDEIEDDEEEEEFDDIGESEDELSDSCSQNSEDSVNDEDFQDIIDSSANDPIYEGAPITVIESVLSILSLMLAFRVTGVLVAKILEIIELHCKKPNKCLKTLYKLKLFFKKLNVPLKRHFFCCNCFSALKDKNSKCNKCKDKVDVKYFIEIPILYQLKKLFKRPGFYEKISTHRFNRKKKHKNNLEDIYDGSVYQNEIKKGFLSNKSNFSFIWNTDGVPLFKSSKFAIWPLYLVINELPYEERFKKENVIIAGIWFGPQKPNANLFINVFRDSFKKLYKGIYFKTSDKNLVISKAKIICGTCDLPAKALFLNLKQFNGYYGCQKCKIRGLRIDKTHTYPYDENLILRTSKETIEYAKQATILKEDVFGVKGPTAMSEIVDDFIGTTSVDVMHCVYLNITKRLMAIWFEAEHSNHPASMRGFIAIVNKFLISIRPVEWVPRRPRSLDDSSYWKASELKAFLLIYSLPILKMFLPEVYYKHHILLVNAIRILNSESISNKMLIEAEKLLKEYVKRFEILYGKIHMTANIHLLLHLVDSVRAFGPCFTTSCFPFEDLNGTLKSFVHGSKNPELQIYSSTCMFLSLTKLKDVVLDKVTAAANFCKKTELRTKMRRKLTKIDEKSSMIGTYYKEKQENINILKENFPFLTVPSNLYFFKRVMLSKIIYETQNYSSGKKTNSSCVKFVHDNEEKYGCIKNFVKTCHCDCNAASNCNCNPKVCKYYAIVTECKSTIAFFNDLNGYIHGMNVLNKNEPKKLLALELKNIILCCFQIETDDETYFIEPVNCKEIE